MLFKSCSHIKNDKVDKKTPLSTQALTYFSFLTPPYADRLTALGEMFAKRMKQ